MHSIIQDNLFASSDLVEVPRGPKKSVGPHPATFVENAPAYRTPWGAMYCADSLGLLRQLRDESVNLVLTSPPYALHFKKEYGNVDKAEYVKWFRPFASEIRR